MTTKHKAVGKRITQKDAVLKATGEGIYVADVNLPGQLWGKVLHSPYAHARILRYGSTAIAEVGLGGHIAKQAGNRSGGPHPRQPTTWHSSW